MLKRPLFRTIFIILIIILIVFLGFVFKKIFLSFASSQIKTSKLAQKLPAQDHILVKFKSQTTPGQKQDRLKIFNSSIRRQIPQIGVDSVNVPAGQTSEEFLNNFKNNNKDVIEFAEPDGYYQTLRIPNDPYYQSYQYNLKQLNAESAWDISTGNAGTKTAVVDTGADFAHEDLQGRLINGYDYIDNDQSPNDEHYHGTCVAGILGAATNNSKGVAGATWQNPMLVIRIGDAMGYASYEDMASAFIYAADNGARAVNISFGGYYDSETVRQAVDYAWSKNSVIIAAAGNEGTSDPIYPAAIPNVVAVSALDSNDVISDYSTYGSFIDVAAYGTVTCPLLGGGYATGSGTSFAAPEVAALFGLVFSINPSLSQQRAIDVVKQTATDLGSAGVDIYYGSGKVNFLRAVQEAGNINPTPVNVNLTINLQGRTDKTSTSDNLKAYNAGGSTKVLDRNDISTNSNGAGTFTINTLLPGNYDFSLKPFYYLSQKLANVNLTDNVSLNFNNLKGGDLDNNNLVNSLDFARLSARWGQNDAITDINMDGITNIIDFSILSSNWFVSGQ